MKNRYDVIIAGSGIAGLYAALSFDQKVNILLVSKRGLELSNSALAQGGIAAVLDTQSDSPAFHREDTLAAGGYQNDRSAIDVMVSEGPEQIRRLINWDVNFDRDGDGNLAMTLEGGHSRRRVVHYKDSTGVEVIKKLTHQVRQLPNVDIIENALLYDLTQTQGGILANLLVGSKGAQVGASYVLLATGGIGRVYKYTTNSAIATGDGICLAERMGARIRRLDCVQFHPTAFAARQGRERFLISEAVRGEGALLLNCDRERFMERYDKRLELAPRDVVSNAIILESRRTGSESFYLDISHKDAGFLKNRFPMIYRCCLEQGVDITRDRIPIFPCQHYLMGGIDVDLFGRTTVGRLYAAGECSHTGVHGNNRLASNSLLEALVFSRRSALDIMDRLGSDADLSAAEHSQRDISGSPLPSGLRTKIREIMQRACFVIPDVYAAAEGLRRVEYIKNRLTAGKFAMTADYFEAKNLADIAYIILKEVLAK